MGAQAGATFPHVAVTDGFELKFGEASMRVLETPGHTPESICLVVTDAEKSAEPWAVLTGDTLFIGDVGRPDLSPRHTPVQLAGMLYDSLHEKLLALPDSVLVYPAHGAGSLCGKNMRAERSSTIGTERLTNYALQIKSREEFVAQLTSNLPARPEYFLKDAEINRAGAAALSDLPPMRAIMPAELQAMLTDGELALDVRPGDEFAAGARAWFGQHRAIRTVRVMGWHGSGIDGASCADCGVGRAIGRGTPQARTRRSRSARWIFAGGVAAWKQAALPSERLRRSPRASSTRVSSRQHASARRTPRARVGRGAH